MSHVERFQLISTISNKKSARELAAVCNRYVVINVLYTDGVILKELEKSLELTGAL